MMDSEFSLPISDSLSIDDYVLEMDANMHPVDVFPFTTTTNDLPSYEHLEMNVQFPSDDPCPLDLEELEVILSGQIDDLSSWMKFTQEEVLVKGWDSDWEISGDLEISGANSCQTDEKSSLSPSTISREESNIEGTSAQPLIMPTETMKMNNQLSLDHLTKAYVEAIENKQAELAEMIKGRISEKVNPINGEIRERLLYYTFQPLDKQADYLRQESFKNFDKAFEAFYQILPYGLVSHFTANSTILEAMPRDAEILHLVDFDMGEGVQWASMIMALGQQNKELQQQYNCGQSPQPATLKITSIKWQELDCCSIPPWRCFEETKIRLQDYAKSCGLMLRVEEMKLQDLVSEVKIMRNRGERKEWLAFNCMWALPHMGRRRSVRDVMEFLSVANDLIANPTSSNNSIRGLITFGDGGDWKALKNCPSFGLFYEKHMEHYQALLESMEWNFPVRLAEARVAMECLFLAPYLTYLHWMQKWEDIKGDSCDIKTRFGFKGLRMSNASLMEAKEMVREGETPFGVRIEGENSNEMVLEWRGIPLLRVSVWR